MPELYAQFAAEIQLTEDECNGDISPDDLRCDVVYVRVPVQDWPFFFGKLSYH